MPYNYKSRNGLQINVLLWLKIILVATVTCLFLESNDVRAEKPPLLILDTDLSSDVDDVGAVALLHGLANQGRVRILAMMISSGDQWSVPCLNAINTWYGRPDIPIGMIKGKSVSHESKYTRKIAEAFPHTRKTGTEAPDAVQLYRKILAAQADQSVTLVTVGYLTNLHNLLLSEADAISPLDGKTLVHNKIKTLVCMGGGYPAGYEWNFFQDVPASIYVVKHWPTPVIFSGFEIGKDIWTGAGLQKAEHPNPIRRSYELYNTLTDRPSWDQVTVFYAVETADGQKTDLWSRVYGRNSVHLTGRNYWYNNVDGQADHSYLVQRGDTGEIANLLEQLMLTPSR